MRVAILDDYFDTLRTLRCFAKLAPFDVTVFSRIGLGALSKLSMACAFTCVAVIKA